MTDSSFHNNNMKDDCESSTKIEDTQVSEISVSQANTSDHLDHESNHHNLDSDHNRTHKCKKYVPVSFSVPMKNRNVALPVHDYDHALHMAHTAHTAHATMHPAHTTPVSVPHKQILFYTDNRLVKAALERRRYWKFNPDKSVQNDFVFRVNLANKSMIADAKIKHQILWEINGKCKQFALLKSANYPHIPPTHLTLEDFDKNEQDMKSEDRWFYKKGHSSCGNGVFLCTDRQTIETNILEHNVQYVLQKQVSPLLYMGKRAVADKPYRTSMIKSAQIGRKFDLRVYVLVDMKNNVYLYNDFLCRICKKTYSGTSKDNKVQLTNIAQGAAMIPLSKWDSVNIEASDIFQNVKQAVKDLAPILKKCNRVNLHKKFTFLGCDYIIDDQGKALLLEINDSPTLADNKTYVEIGRLQTRVMSDFAKRFIEPVFLGTRYASKGNWISVC